MPLDHWHGRHYKLRLLSPFIRVGVQLFAVARMMAILFAIAEEARHHDVCLLVGAAAENGTPPVTAEGAQVEDIIVRDARGAEHDFLQKLCLKIQWWPCG